MVGGRKGMVVLALGASVLVGGCNAQNAKETGGAIGTLLGTAVGIALGSNNDIGPVGGALLGGVAGFLAGTMVGAVVDEVDRVRQKEATQAALNSGSTMYWASPKSPGIYGRTEIVQTVTVPVGTPGTQTIVQPANGLDLPAVYCLPGNDKPYRLEAPRCPSNGVREISREQYLTMVPEAASKPPAREAEPKKASAQKPKPARVQTASLPAEPVPKPQPAVVAPEPQTETMCRTAREVIYVDGKEQVETVEYCRSPGAVGWAKKAA